MTVRIREWLETALDSGNTELDAAARFIEVSPRTLRRRLHGEGETFQGLLDDVRRVRALGHLGHGDLPIGEVSRVLGFTRITSFYRAFRRWTGTTPANYRTQHRSTHIEQVASVASLPQHASVSHVEGLIPSAPMVAARSEASAPA